AFSRIGTAVRGSRPLPSFLIRTSRFFFPSSDRKTRSPSAPKDTLSPPFAIWRGGVRRSRDASQICDSPPSSVVEGHFLLVARNIVIRDGDAQQNTVGLSGAEVHRAQFGAGRHPA